MMGEYMVPKSFKFPRWMLTRLAVEQQRFAPFARNESETLRLLLHIAFSLIDNGSLERVLGALQDLQGKTVYTQGMTLDSSGKGQKPWPTTQPEFLQVHPGVFSF
jgi:hypothetical protein